MRIATPEDFEEIKRMSLEFIKQTPYKDRYSEEAIENLINKILSSPKDEMILLITEGGFIAAASVPFLFGPSKVVSEIAWWVDEDKRKTGTGAALLSALEYWAKEVAKADMVTMASLISDLDSYYEKKGYKLYEKAYMKIL